MNIQEGNDSFAIILTSVSVELLAFGFETDKISDEDINNLTSLIVKRIDRVLKENGYQILDLSKTSIDEIIEMKMNLLLPQQPKK